MNKYLPYALGGILICACAYFQGAMTDRWSEREVTEEQKLFAASLAKVPQNLGEWKGSDSKIDERAIKASHAQGYVSRTYRHQYTGDEVDVYLVAGAPQYVTDHNPDNCYICQGYKMEDATQVYPIETETSPAKFHTTVFSKAEGTDRLYLRIFWGWSTGGNWEAPGNPGYTYVNAPALYKVYFIQRMREKDHNPGTGAAVKFIKQFVPVLEQSLVSEKNKSAEKDATAEKDTAAKEKSA